MKNLIGLSLIFVICGCASIQSAKNPYGESIFPSNEAILSAPQKNEILENPADMVLHIIGEDQNAYRCGVIIVSNAKENKTTLVLILDSTEIAQYNSVTHRIMASNPEISGDHLLVFLDKNAIENLPEGQELIQAKPCIVNQVMFEKLKEDFQIEKINGVVIQKEPKPKSPAPKQRKRPTFSGSVRA